MLCSDEAFAEKTEDDRQSWTKKKYYHEIRGQLQAGQYPGRYTQYQIKTLWMNIAKPENQLQIVIQLHLVR